MRRERLERKTKKKTFFKKKRELKDRDKDILGREFRKRFCRFCQDKVKLIDYKDVNRLQKFINERGKIISRRFSFNCAKHQRKLSQAIKRARFLALLTFNR